MKRIAITLLTLVAGIVFVGSIPQLNAQAGGGFKTLLDGKNFNNFTPIGDANWKVAEGAVQADMGTGFLVSKQSYGDFELRAEFWVTDDANSGIFIRAENPKEITAMNAYEVNIFDKRPDQAYRTGAIVDVAKPAAVVNTGGKWNTMEIIAKGPRMIVKVNGMQTVDVQDMKHARGPFALQRGAGTVKWRKVEIR